MHTITFYLDFVSPYAWLAFQQLPQTLEGLSYRVHYKPVLLGALLQEQQNPGPARIPHKRAWVYRHALWLGKHLGVTLQMPAMHPFPPLPLLRLALQTSDDGCINRFVAQSLFEHVWCNGGADPNAPERLQTLQNTLCDQLQGASDKQEQAKQWLRRNTQEALEQGVFGVPSLVAKGKVFWGLDSLPMLRAALDGDPWFESNTWEALTQLPTGMT